ncbi:MAG: hypothetical protein BAA03_06695 [Caldibacillus debilis]|nr:MAG: hypothetical protein BAA03_06695 [Caldibacillus debilis]
MPIEKYPPENELHPKCQARRQREVQFILGGFCFFAGDRPDFFPEFLADSDFSAGTEPGSPFPEESAGSRSRTEQQDSRCPDPFPKGMFTGRRGAPSPLAGKGSGCSGRHLFGREGRKHARPVKPLHRPRPFRRFGRFNAGARRPIIEIRNLKRQIAQADKRCRTKAKRWAAESREDNVSPSSCQNGRNGPEIMEI